MRIAVAIVVFTLVLLAVYSSLYTVDQAEFGYVTQFGRHIQTHDGTTDAGLHVKWPWPIQSVQRVDRRLQMFDLPAAELPTYDPAGKTIDKMLTVDGYVCWQIADERGVDQFIRTVGTPERAREILWPRITDRVGAVISKLRQEDLISPGLAPLAAEFRVPFLDIRLGDLVRLAVIDARARRLQTMLLGDGLDDLRTIVREQYGIVLIDVRLRRLNYTESARQAIFNRIRSERSRKAAEYESEGESKAREIRSLAERDADIVRSTAQANADRTRKQADADADRIRNEAHSKDREFYTFLQTLDAYKQMLGKTNDMLLLSSKHPLFKWLLTPPTPPAEKK